MRAHVHGARDGLWWEFSLASSFRWQARIRNLPEGPFRHRVRELVQSLGIADQLPCRVGDLTPGQRALADLAVALAGRPRLLIWAEPFTLMTAVERQAALRTVRHLAQGEGLIVVTRTGRRSGLGKTESERGAVPCNAAPIWA